MPASISPPPICYGEDVLILTLGAYPPWMLVRKETLDIYGAIYFSIENTFKEMDLACEI